MQVGLNRTGTHPLRGLDDSHELRETFVEQRVGDTQSAHLIGDAAIGPPDLR